MDIREHLKSLPVGKLKDLARRHNKLYRIKIGQTKDELVESLAKQYEKFTGTNLIPRRVDLVVEPIKLTKKQLPKPAAPAPAPAPRAAPLPVFIKANEALKEKVRKYNEARLAKQKAEKQITEVIKQVEPVIKEVESIPKFSYNEKFVFNPSQEQLKLMAGNQEKFDFYQTPRDVLQQIYNDLFVYSQRYLQFNGTNALEPSAGNGALLSLLIDNQDTLKLKNLDAIEYDENMAKLLKENFKISHIYNDNFFTFKQERPYDLILMNPPYEGLVGTNSENRFNSKVAHLYHIARAILLKSSNGTAKTIYAVVPQLKGVSWPREFPNNKQYEFEDVVMTPDMKRMEKIFGMPFDDFPRALITRIGTSDSFEKIVYSRGKFNKRPLGLKVDIYRILVF